VSALLGNADVAAAIAPEDRRTLGNPDTYLGMAEQFRRRLIAGARE
jgi:hypothetical protein